MKVAILSFYSGLVNRGVETWAKNLKEKTSKEIDVDIVGGEEFGSKIKWDKKSYNHWRLLLLKHAFKYYSRWSKADIVIPTNGTVQTLVCRIFTWLLRKPTIVFGHSGPGADDKWNLLCSPNVFVAFSNHQHQWAMQHKLPWTKVIKISHAVDVNRFKPAKSKPKENIILCVAANTPDKRIDLVERAVALIPNAKFLAVGKGNPTVASFEEMPRIYRKAKVFCFTPQPWEAFGLVLLEALASNLPVVTTDDPIRREIVGHAGIFVKDPEDQEKLATAIELALKLKWGMKPRKQAEKFSWKAVTPKYINLFETLVK